MSRANPQPLRAISRRRRRGSIYLFVLATATIIATVVGGTLYAQTQRLRSERLSADASKARIAAASGLEVIRAWIAQDANWRANRSDGRWASNLVLGDAKVDLDVVDPTDGLIANHPYHSVTITATARVGGAEQILSATLAAKPVPIDALAYLTNVAGQLHVLSGGTIHAGTATASANGDFKNDNTIEGNVLAGTVSKRGAVFGSVATSSTARTMPNATTLDTLIAMGTVLSTDKLDGVTLSSTSNPYGAVNPWGIYVLKPSSGGDVDLKNTTVNGTLIVYPPSGKKAYTEGTVNLITSSGDFPALVVKGDLQLAAAGQITGLVHATGQIQMSSTWTLKGAVIGESTLAADAMKIDGDRLMTYDPLLYQRPPVGYASRVDMVLQPGSYQRVVR